jgi:Domain of unknown function (DUF4351)
VEVDPTTAADWWAIAGTLAGLRLSDAVLQGLMGRVTHMKESSFIKWWEDEGSIREARKIILRQGQRRFGEPDAATVERLNAIRDLTQLEQLADRLLDAGDWSSLLATPEPASP